ncbi:hypothetical protein HU200_063809 [Digitaria exilis]|uniref:Reverse transcriptase zinc-binding domain-containing protein n=1 Tax=Digitaria exilis TaxID=1010633 RepID=A0A835A110_9POAL|nr:hypothetical protein HU200_063809 [Digitaria exilis]
MPSRDNLYRRHIDPLCTCDTCGARDETIFHGLTECTYAWGYWSKLKEFTGVKLPKLDPRSWTEQLLADQFCQERDRSIILCGMSVCGRFGEPGMIADMQHAEEPQERWYVLITENCSFFGEITTRDFSGAGSKS